MKTKKFLALLLSAIMCLSLFTYLVFAEETSEFMLGSYNINASIMDFKYTSEVKSYSVTLKNGTTNISVTSELKSDDPTTLVIKPVSKLDLDKKYILTVTASDGLTTSTVKRAISFDVAWNEDFDSYETVAELENAGYSLRRQDLTPIIYTLSAANALDTTGTSPYVALADDGNGGKKLALRKLSDGYSFTNGVKFKHWYVTEATIDANNATDNNRPNMYIVRDPYFYAYGSSNSSLYSITFWSYQTYISAFTKKVEGSNGNIPQCPQGKFDMVYDAKLPSADATSGVVSLWYNGSLAGRWDDLGKYGQNSQPVGDANYGTADTCKDAIGFMTLSEKVQYIDNIKVYAQNIDTPVYTSVVPPEFTKVELSGTIAVNMPITATIDDTTSTSGISYSYEWYVSDNFKATFPDEWTMVDNASNTHTIAEDESNKYIVCKVVQNLDVGESKLPMKTVLSNKIYGAIVAPRAENVRLEEIKTDEIITGIEVKYDYIDPNVISNENDPNLESGTVYFWEKSETKGDNAVWIETDVTGKVYPITEADNSYFIRCTVTVKNTAEKGDQAIPVTTEVCTLPFAPNATVSLTKSYQSVGKTIVAEYTYYDENGDEETDSEYGWYRCKNKTDEGTLVGSGFAYCLQNSDAGNYIVFRATPKNNAFPQEGETVETERILVEKKSTVGGSSSSSSSSSSISYKNEVSPENYSDKSVVTDNSSEASEAFYDIKNHWAKNEIEKLSKMGVVKGDGNGFNPEGNVTRAEFAAMLARTAGLDTNKKASGSFADVNSDDWYAGIVGAVYESGIMKGDGNSFRPNDSISREEMAKSICDLYSYLGKSASEQEFDISAFTDYSGISSWAVDYVDKACKLGIMKGDEKGNFNAKGIATRAEAAVVLIRVMEAK